MGPREGGLDRHARGDGAYATHTHRMGTQDLQNRAVTAPKIANRAVIPRAIRNNAVRPAKINTNAVRPRHIADEAVGAAQVDPNEVQQRVTGGCTGAGSVMKRVFANGSVDCDNFVAATGFTRVRRQFVNFELSGAQTFPFGQVELRKLATPGQFQVCRTAAGVTTAWVAYVNGSRSQGQGQCTSVLNVASVNSDFEVKMRRTRIWGVHSGDNLTTRSFSVIGVGEF